MSIVGLVIALGLLVDNAIVVVENVSRHLREGEAPKDAAIKGSSQVAWAVASGTLTTVLSFLPMLFMQNGSGTFMRAMPVTVVVTLFASLLIALTLTPLLASKLGSSAKKTTRAQKKLESIADTRYSQVLMWALDRPGKVMSLSVLILIASLALFPYIGVSLFPKAEKPMILVNIDMPEGSTFARTQEIADEVSNRVRQYELVNDVAQNVGRGNPRIYYNIMPTRQTVNFAQLFVTLNDFQLDSVEPLVKTLRSQMSDIPGVKITVKEFMQGPPLAAPISIRIVGEALTDIQQVAIDIENLVANTPGVVGVDNPVGNLKVDLKLDINRDKAAMLGVPLQQVDRSVRTALVGTNMGSFRDDQGEEFPLVLRLSQYQNPQIETFEDIKIQSNTGQLIPLLQIAELNMETSIARFQHYDLERMARITSDVLPGFTTEKVTNDIIAQLKVYDFP
jgi:multidrug efflux pump subunit AcrB